MAERFLRNIFVVLIGAVMLSACSDDDGGNDEPLPEPPIETVGRTVLVYMVADNNLGSSWSFNSKDINEMLKGAAAGDIHDGRLVVYHNRPGTDNGNAPLLLEITAQGVDTLKHYPDDTNVYSIEVDRMREVIADAKELAPANDYGIVFWGHATSWVDIDSFTSSKTPRSYGSDRNRWMSLKSMAKALEGEQFSFVYFDCCLMGTVEVAYELREITPYIIASPTELEGEGMPYHLNLRHFFASGKPDVVAMAKSTFDYYDARPECRCQMTVIDTSALDELAEVSRAIFQTQTAYPGELSSVQALSKRIAGTPSKYNSCRPVYDMEDYMRVLTADRQELMEAWTEVLGKAVAYAATTDYEYTGIRINRYCGLGSYVILEDAFKNYGDYTSTRWWTDVVSQSPLYK